MVNLDQVSDSLGGKGVLWELFSFNPPSLRLYVELCAYSPHLSGILTSNPGMIDSLMDSLVLDKLPTREFLRQTLFSAQPHLGQGREMKVVDALAQLVFIYNLISTIRNGAKAPEMPWEGADSLEWTHLPTPAPYHSFETPPVLK